MSTTGSVQSISFEEFKQARPRLLAYSILTVAWVLLASSFLIGVGVAYRHGAVHDARKRFATASAEQVGLRAAALLNVALTARDAMDYAVQHKLYYEPADYDATRFTLAPLLAASPALRAIDMAFTGRNLTLAVQRWPVGWPGQPEQGPPLLVQSNAVDCFQTLGRLGCLSGQKANGEAWFRHGSNLPAVDGFQWMDMPGFVPHLGDRGSPVTSRSTVAWAPAYPLVFRSLFPGTGGGLSLIGRITLDVGELRSSSQLLNSTALDGGGAILVCDHNGLVVAASEPGWQLLAESPLGQPRFRYAWEFDAIWSQHLRAADFKEGAVLERGGDGFHIAIVPVQGRGMQPFRVVVALAREPFEDGKLISLWKLAELAVALPYPAIATAVLILWSYFEWKERKRRRRIHATSGKELESAGDASQSLRRRRSLKRQLSLTTSMELRAMGY